jgi:hypothetical protein
LVVSQTAAEVVMTTFKVELAQTTIERATVFIECGSADEAERLAVKESRHADWHFAEAYGDIEVIGVEELKWV